MTPAPGDPRSGRAGAAELSRACPYCRSSFTEGEGILTCSVCNAVHHTDCWTENEGCAVWGCEARPSRPMPRPTAEDLQASGGGSGGGGSSRIRIDVSDDGEEFSGEFPSMGSSGSSGGWDSQLSRVDAFLVAGLRDGRFSASRKALAQLAAKLRVRGRSSMNKSQLEEAVLEFAARRRSAGPTLASLNLVELYAISAAFELPGRSGMSREQLVEAIERAQSEPGLVWKAHPQGSNQAHPQGGRGRRFPRTSSPSSEPIEEQTGTFAVFVFLGICLGLVVGVVILGIQGKLF